MQHEFILFCKASSHRSEYVSDPYRNEKIACQTHASSTRHFNRLAFFHEQVVPTRNLYLKSMQLSLIFYKIMDMPFRDDWIVSDG